MKSLSHQFLDFCRSKPADEEYNYGDIENCAVSQFARDRGLLHLIGVCGPSDLLGDKFTVLNMDGGPATFGALTSRLEKALER